MKRILTALVIASAVAISAGVADARDLRLTPGAPPVHPAVDPLYNKLVELLPEETGGALTGTIVGPEVVNILQIKDALQSSLSEVGNLLPLFVPGDLPSTAIAGDLAFLATTSHAMGAAMSEYVATCEDCQAEFNTLGAVFTGAGSSDIYLIMTTKPVVTLADMQGLRLRSGGAPYTRWAEALGGSPAQIGVSDQFEAISQGVIDGTMGSISDLLSYRLIDVVTDVTEVRLGTYHTTSNFTVALPVWAEFTVEERAGFVRAANRASAYFTQSWGYDRAAGAKQAAIDAGITFHEPAQDLVDATEAFRAADLEAAIGVATTQLGLDDAAEKIGRFQELVAKWTELLDGMNDPEAIAALVQAEVWDKVDYSTYGM
jgi:TRAP-type C4-dicarboxylate transport system substrate-binding protein